MDRKRTNGWMLFALLLTFSFVIAAKPNLSPTQLASAQGVATPITKHLAVNGRPIEGTILAIDGKYYVSIDDLAQSLAGSIGYSDEKITLTIPTSPSIGGTPLTSQQHDAGGIKGTLTFNSNVGSRPDTGTEIWLVEGDVSVPADQLFSGYGDHVQIGKANYNIVKHTIADGNGTFVITDVPVGQYTLIMQSKHTNGAIALRPSEMITQRDAAGRVVSRALQVKAGETLDESLDFGRTVLP
jgi:hypothetical protein